MINGVMTPKKFVRTCELESGMILGNKITNQYGQVLINSGIRLSDIYINAIKRWKLGGVYIVDDTPASVMHRRVMESVDANTVEDRNNVSIAMSVRKRAAESLNFLYSNTDDERLTNITRLVVNDLLCAIRENNAVAVDINELRICDEYTFKHSVDVATISMIVAKSYGLSEHDIFDIGVSGLLHDIGKSKVPLEILNKPSRLTDDEYAVMKRHPAFGFDILRKRQDLSDRVKIGVLQHHEKENGSGYPLGLTGDRIGIFSKIITVADIYDALVTERPYKEGYSPKDAVEMIMSMTEELNMKAMQSFLRSIILYPVGSDIMLSNGVRCRVVENNTSFVLRPKVVSLENGFLYDLASPEWLSLVIV